jgi:hypothetical protein
MYKFYLDDFKVIESLMKKEKYLIYLNKSDDKVDDVKTIKNIEVNFLI